MGRKPKDRGGNFDADVVKLTSIIRAVRVDTTRTQKWRDEAIGHLQSTIRLFAAGKVDGRKTTV